MPTIARGRLFQFDRYGGQARLTAMESETGRDLWKFEYPTDYRDVIGYDNGPRCSPVVDGGRVYLFGAEGMLHCVSAIDGKLVWKVDTAKQFNVVQNFFGVGSTPVVEGDLLIAQVGGSPPGMRVGSPDRLDLVKGNGSGIVAFDKFTGKVKYQITDELASYAGPVLATSGGRRWCFVFARGGLVGFNPASGKVDFEYAWRAEELFSVNASNPVVVDDRVFISETYGPGSSLLRVKPGGYDVVWKDPNASWAEGVRDPDARRQGPEMAMQTHWNTPVQHDSYVYGSSGRHSNNAELRCMQLATGKIMWSEPGLSRSSLLFVDGHFICLTEYGELLLLRATPDRFDAVARVKLRDKAQLGKSPSELIEYPAWAAPIVSHGLLYVRGKDRLVCLDLEPKTK